MIRRIESSMHWGAVEKKETNEHAQQRNILDGETQCFLHLFSYIKSSICGFYLAQNDCLETAYRIFFALFYSFSMKNEIEYTRNENEQEKANHNWNNDNDIYYTCRLYVLVRIIWYSTILYKFDFAIRNKNDTSDEIYLLHFTWAGAIDLYLQFYFMQRLAFDAQRMIYCTVLWIISITTLA